MEKENTEGKGSPIVQRRKGKRNTKQEDTERGRSPSIQKGNAEAVQNTRTQRGEDRGQYTVKRPRLHKTRGRRGGRNRGQCREERQKLYKTKRNR